MTQKLALLPVLLAIFGFAYGEQQPLQVPAIGSDWEALKSRVGGRLHPSVPFSQPCYEDPRSKECQEIQKGYGDDSECYFEKGNGHHAERPGFIRTKSFDHSISAHSKSESNATLSYLFVPVTDVSKSVNTNWETCQATGAECLLNSTDPSDISPTSPPNHCRLGAVPSHFVCRSLSKLSACSSC